MVRKLLFSHDISTIELPLNSLKLIDHFIKSVENSNHAMQLMEDIFVVCADFDF